MKREFRFLSLIGSSSGETKKEELKVKSQKLEKEN